MTKAHNKTKIKTDKIKKVTRNVNKNCNTKITLN